jgi:hypothetical protein
MIAMVFVVLGGFSTLLWWSFRSARRRAARGETFAPDGKIRWS